MIYDTLLIDLDGTVLDFEANQEQALTKLFLNRGIVLTEEMRQYYRDFNARLWLEHETGKISVRELCDTRFARFLARFGHTVDGADWEREYREYLGEGSQTMPHALEVCGELARECRLYVATNGVRKTQMRRLTDSGLLPLFRDVFDSESIGVQKPFAGFFDHVAANIPDFCPEKTLMVGDSPASDIKGGLEYGLSTVWYDPKGKLDCGGLTPDWRITDLRQLLTLCRTGKL